MTETTSTNIDRTTTSSNNVKPLLLRWPGSPRLGARGILKAFDFINELDLLIGHNPVKPLIHLRSLVDVLAQDRDGVGNGITDPFVRIFLTKRETIS